MAVYLAERSLPGITLEQLGQAQQAAIRTSRQLTADLFGLHECALTVICAHLRRFGVFYLVPALKRERDRL